MIVADSTGFHLPYYCKACNAQYANKIPRCKCGAWNTVIGHAGIIEPGQSRKPVPVPITSVEFDATPKITTGFESFDRVLGGGAPLGGAILIGGDRGIGKSTILLQSLCKMADSGSRVLYVTAEETNTKIKENAVRIVGADSLSANFLVMATGAHEDIKDAIELGGKWSAIVLDSLQTIRCEDIEGQPGYTSQVKAVAQRTVELCKALGIVLFIVAHVTKEGDIAGPNTVEHLVDIVLFIEGMASDSSLVTLKCDGKNRFGAATEAAQFRMTAKGLVPCAS